MDFIYLNLLITFTHQLSQQKTLFSPPLLGNFRFTAWLLQIVQSFQKRIYLSRSYRNIRQE